MLEKNSDSIIWEFGIYMTIVTLIFHIGSTRITESKNKQDEQIYDHLNHTIEIVEEDGYLTKKEELKLEVFIDENTHYDWIEIKGTKQKVDKGEPVYLYAKVGNNSRFSGVSNTKKFYKEGVAK